MHLRRTALAAALAAALASPAALLEAQVLQGAVTGSAGEPLAGVRVQVIELSRTAVTDSAGRYFIQLPRGTYSVAFRMVGYRAELRRVSVPEAGTWLAAMMQAAPLAIDALQVTATAGATSAFTSPQPTAVLGGEALHAAQAPSVGETLEPLPGVRNWSTGAGIGKPVIRGLTSNRVVVLADGIRLDYQQWGDEHSPNLETSGAERIEVIRGPASVLYGSDALGGVVNVISSEVPQAAAGESALRGRVSASYASNGRAPDAVVALEAVGPALGLRGTVSGRRSGDQGTPRGALPNSGNEALGGDVAATWRPRWGTLKLGAGGRQERLEIHDDPVLAPGSSSYQRIADARGRMELNVPLGRARLELLAGWERNRRREYAADTAQDVQLGLLAESMNLESRLHGAFSERAFGIAGLSLVRGDFIPFGVGRLIPASAAFNVGAYAMHRVEWSRWHLSAGVRVDRRVLDVKDEPQLGIAARRLTYGAVTGNVGVLYHVAEPVALVLNVGRGFRAPAVAELFADGQHQGTQQYEVGDPTIGVETSTNVDLALRARGTWFELEGGGYVNTIHDYIYAWPTGTNHAPSGLPIWQFVQGDARLVGMEVNAQVRPAEGWLLRLGADVVRGTNLATDAPLPWMPPLRVSYAVRYEFERLLGIERAYAGLAAETHARQSRADPNEVVPAGYTTVQLNAGFPAIGPGGLRAEIVVRNLFDAPYASFLSRYKAYALAPGRSVQVRVSRLLP